jgi:hypothetical protein
MDTDASRSSWRRIYDFFTKHWIVSTALLSVPGLIWVGFRLKGEEYGLVKDGRTTFRGELVFWIAIVWSLGVSFAKAWADQRNQEAKAHGLFLLGRLNRGVTDIVQQKLKHYRQYVRALSNGDLDVLRDPFQRLVQPEAQIGRVLNAISATLREIFKIDNPHDMGIGVLVESEPGKWRWIEELNFDADLPVEKLLAAPNSSINQIILSGKETVFVPDKRTGQTRNEYLPGPKDQSNDGKGSIICRNISVGDDPCQRAILCITTYGTQLCEDGDESSKVKILKVLLPPLEDILKLELCLLYVKERLGKDSRDKGESDQHVDGHDRNTAKAPESRVGDPYYSSTTPRRTVEVPALASEGREDTDEVSLK